MPSYLDQLWVDTMMITLTITFLLWFWSEWREAKAFRDRRDRKIIEDNGNDG